MCDRQSMKTQIENEKIKHNKSNQIKKKKSWSSLKCVTEAQKVRFFSIGLSGLN